MNFIEEYQYLTDENHIFKEISYEELIDMFDTFNTGLVMIGGAWCKNTQAVMGYVNALGKRRGIDTVYVFDPKFINEAGLEEDMRDCLSLEVKLKYYGIIERVKYENEIKVKDTLIARMPVPTFVAIRNGSCSGYYSCEFIKDEYLHKEGELDDVSVEFIDSLITLMESIKQ